jgi:hypothetical protein
MTPVTVPGWPYDEIMAAVGHYGRVCRAHAPDEVQEAAHAKVARLVLDAVYPRGGGR